MQTPSHTPAERPADDAQPVMVGRQPVILSERIRVEGPQAGDRFSFGVSLCEQHQDVPAMSIYTGGAHVMLYPTPVQARQIAALLVKLAEASERVAGASL